MNEQERDADRVRHIAELTDLVPRIIEVATTSTRPGDVRHARRLLREITSLVQRMGGTPPCSIEPESER